MCESWIIKVTDERGDYKLYKEMLKFNFVDMNSDVKFRERMDKRVFREERAMDRELSKKKKFGEENFEEEFDKGKS